MKTILVVDDSHADQILIAGLLAVSGFEVVPAYSSSAAWQWLESHKPPQLILLDIVMRQGEQSGFALCRSLRDTPQFKQIPIVFCTSKEREQDRFWALRQGANDYITKPFSPNKLIDVALHHTTEVYSAHGFI